MLNTWLILKLILIYFSYILDLPEQVSFHVWFVFTYHFRLEKVFFYSGSENRTLSANISPARRLLGKCRYKLHALFLQYFIRAALRKFSHMSKLEFKRCCVNETQCNKNIYCYRLALSLPTA